MWTWRCRNLSRWVLTPGFGWSPNWKSFGGAANITETFATAMLSKLQTEHTAEPPLCNRNYLNVNINSSTSMLGASPCAMNMSWATRRFSQCQWSSFLPRPTFESTSTTSFLPSLHSNGLLSSYQESASWSCAKAVKHQWEPGYVELSLLSLLWRWGRVKAMLSYIGIIHTVKQITQMQPVVFQRKSSTGVQKDGCFSIMSSFFYIYIQSHTISKTSPKQLKN